MKEVQKREGDSCKTGGAEAVFCSVIRRALTMGRHWGCFCSLLECLVVYLHSWLRGGRQQWGKQHKVGKVEAEQ